MTEFIICPKNNGSMEVIMSWARLDEKQLTHTKFILIKLVFLQLIITESQIIPFQEMLL